MKIATKAEQTMARIMLKKSLEKAELLALMEAKKNWIRLLMFLETAVPIFMNLERSDNTDF